MWQMSVTRAAGSLSEEALLSEMHEFEAYEALARVKGGSTVPAE